MSREHPDYRANIELLNELFPGKIMLNLKDCTAAYGCSVNTVKKRLGKDFKGGYISKATLARKMCG